MARLRFPGRPGQRYGRSLIRFMPHEARNSQILFFNLTANIQRNLKWFYDTFGDSDEEEEEFDGFTLDDDELLAYQQLQERRALELQTRKEPAQLMLQQTQRVHGRNVRNVIRRSYAAMLRGEEDLSPKSYILKRPEELVGYGVQPEESCIEMEASSATDSASPSKSLTTIKIKFLPDGKKAKIVRHRRPPSSLNLDFVRQDLGAKSKALTKQEKRLKMMQEKFEREQKVRERIRKKKERERQRKQEKVRREKLRREKVREKRRQKKLREKAKKEKMREKKRARALAKKEKLRAKKKGLSLPRQKNGTTAIKSEPLEPQSEDTTTRASKVVNRLRGKKTEIVAARQILARAKEQRRKQGTDSGYAVVGKRMVTKSRMLNDMVADVKFLQRIASPTKPVPYKHKTGKSVISVKRGRKNQQAVEKATASLQSPQFLNSNADINDYDATHQQRTGVLATSVKSSSKDRKAVGKARARPALPQFPDKRTNKNSAYTFSRKTSLPTSAKLKNKGWTDVKKATARPVSPERDSDKDSHISSPPSATKIAGSFFLPSFSARSSRIIKPCKRYLEESGESPSLKAPRVLSSPRPISASSPRQELPVEEVDENSSFADVSSDDDGAEYMPRKPSHQLSSQQQKTNRKKLISPSKRTQKLRIHESSSKLKSAPRQLMSIKIRKPLKSRQDIKTGSEKGKDQKENIIESPISNLVQTFRSKAKKSSRVNSASQKAQNSFILGCDDLKKIRRFQKMVAKTQRRLTNAEGEKKPELTSPVLQEVKGSHRAHLQKLAKDKRAAPLSGEVKTPQHSRPMMGGDRSTHLDAVSKQMAEAMEADMSPEQTVDKPTKTPKPDVQVRGDTPVSRGPRIKHVCRRASVALGLEVATFPDPSMSSDHTLSALPPEEKETVYEPIKRETTNENEGVQTPSKYNRKNRGANYKRMREELLNDGAIAEEEGVPYRPKKGQRMPGMDMPYGHNQKFRVAPFKGLKVASSKRRRCGKCGPCQRKDDCGVCEFCLDKTKFGGPNTKRQACIHRKCWNPQYKSEVLREVQEGKRQQVSIPNYMRKHDAMEEQEQVEPVTSASYQQVRHKASPFKQRPRLGKPKARIKLPTRRGALKVFASSRPMSRAQRQRMEKEKAKLRRLETNRNSSSSLTVAKLKAKPQVEPLKITHHRINIDFKEDYDVDTAWQRGIAILSSEPMVPRTVCYLCSSTGKHELIYCNVCCEPFHSFCLEDNERPLEGEKENWCCRRCKFCHVCGRQEKLLTCDKCHSSYHPECLGPNYPTKPSRRRKIWVCTKCVKCKSCGATTPGQTPNAQWSHDFSLCQDCGKLFDRGNYCPICSQCYEDDDYVSKMMQCAQCDRWVHAKCEGLTDDMYHIMTDLPESVPYTCAKCDPVRPAKWQVELAEEMEAGFENVLRAMFHCRSAAHLVSAEKKAKHSRSANRSSSPASSTGTPRDLTSSPALSDTLSVDSHSSPGESRTDFISRRVSPRFLKDQKARTGSPLLRTRERTEASSSAGDLVSTETTGERDANADGNTQGTAGKEGESPDAAANANEPVAVETAEDSNSDAQDKGHVADVSSGERLNANEDAAVTNASEGSSVDGTKEPPKVLSESNFASDPSLVMHPSSPKGQVAVEDRLSSEQTSDSLEDSSSRNEPSEQVPSVMAPGADSSELSTKNQTSDKSDQDLLSSLTPQDERTSAEPPGEGVGEVIMRDESGTAEVSGLDPNVGGMEQRTSNPTSATNRITVNQGNIVKESEQPSAADSDVSVQFGEGHSANGTTFHQAQSEAAPDRSHEQSQVQQNELSSSLTSSRRSSNSEEVIHVLGDELTNTRSASVWAEPQTKPVSPTSDSKRTDAEDQSDSSADPSVSKDSTIEQAGNLATEGVTAPVHDGIPGNRTGTDDIPDAKNGSKPGDSILLKDIVKNLDDSISMEVSLFRGLTEKQPGETDHPKDLKAVNKRVKKGHYKTVAEFCDDCVRIIQQSLSSETEQSQTLKRNNRTACSIFLKHMTKMFPWYKVETSRSWEQNQKFPDGMLSQAVLPPHSDHEYAQWKHRNHPFPQMLQPSPLKRLPFSPTSRAPARIIGGNAQVTPVAEPNTDDTRRCCLCGRFSDEDPNDGGRLLYCGQDEWIHINCGLWSAEVFEEMDGSLINVHAAIWRGRQLRCEGCGKFGATVGCCQRGCPANFHFMCAREKDCVFQEDKKVFCSTHRDKVDRDTIQNGNFAVLRRVCVSLDNMKLNRNFTQGLEVSRINMMVGSLTVDDLGRLGPASDQEDALYPLEFRCQRVYWSTFDARRRCVYTIRIFEYKAVATPKSPLDVNHTTAHSPGVLNKRAFGKSHAHITELAGDMPSIPEMDEEGSQLGVPKAGVETVDGVFELSLDSTGLESLLDPEMLLQCEAELRDGCIDPDAMLTAALDQVDAEIAKEMEDSELALQEQSSPVEPEATTSVDHPENVAEESGDRLSKSCPSFGAYDQTTSSCEDVRLTQSWPTPVSCAVGTSGLSEKTLKSLPQSVLTKQTSLTTSFDKEGSDLSDDLSRMVMSLNYAAQSGKIEEARRRSSQDSVASSQSTSEKKITEIQSSEPTADVLLSERTKQITGSVPSVTASINSETTGMSFEERSSPLPSRILEEISQEPLSTALPTPLDSVMTNTEMTSEQPSKDIHSTSYLSKDSLVESQSTKVTSPGTFPESDVQNASEFVLTSTENFAQNDNHIHDKAVPFSSGSSLIPDVEDFKSEPLANPSLGQTTGIPTSCIDARSSSQVDHGSSSEDTPTRSIFKFIDKLLTESGEDCTRMPDTTKSVPSQTGSFPDGADFNNVSQPSESEGKGLVQESSVLGSDKDSAMEQRETSDSNVFKTSPVCLDGTEKSILKHELESGTKIPRDVESSDNVLLRGFPLSANTGVQQEGYLSSQESTDASKSGMDTYSDEDTDLSQRTQDIVTDVIALERLSEHPVLPVAEQEPLLSTAEMVVSELNHYGKDSSTDTTGGDLGDLEMISEQTLTRQSPERLSPECEKISEQTQGVSSTEQGTDQSSHFTTEVTSEDHSVMPSEGIFREDSTSDPTGSRLENLLTDVRVQMDSSPHPVREVVNHHPCPKAEMGAVGNTQPEDRSSSAMAELGTKELSDPCELMSLVAPSEDCSVNADSAASSDDAAYTSPVDSASSQNAAESKSQSGECVTSSPLDMDIDSLQSGKEEKEIGGESPVKTSVEQSMSWATGYVGDTDKTENKDQLEAESMDVDADFSVSALEEKEKISCGASLEEPTSPNVPANMEVPKKQSAESGGDVQEEVRVLHNLPLGPAAEVEKSPQVAHVCDAASYQLEEVSKGSTKESLMVEDTTCQPGKMVEHEKQTDEAVASSEEDTLAAKERKELPPEGYSDEDVEPAAKRRKLETQASGMPSENVDTCLTMADEVAENLQEICSPDVHTHPVASIQSQQMTPSSPDVSGEQSSSCNRIPASTPEVQDSNSTSELNPMVPPLGEEDNDEVQEGMEVDKAVQPPKVAGDLGRMEPDIDSCPQRELTDGEESKEIDSRSAAGVNLSVDMGSDSLSSCTVQNLENDVFVVESECGNRGPDDQSKKCDPGASDLSQIQATQTLRKAVVVLHDICNSRNKRTRSLSCSLSSLPGRSSESSTPVSQSPSINSTTPQSKSLPNTPCFGRSLSRELPNMADAVTKEGIAESEDARKDFEIKEGFVEESQESNKMDLDELSDDEPLSRLSEKLKGHKDQTSEVQKETEQESAGAAKPSEDFILDDKTGMFVSSASLSPSSRSLSKGFDSASVDDDAAGGKSPSGRKQYPMRSTFSRLTRIIEDPDERPSRRKKSASVTSASKERASSLQGNTSQNAREEIEATPQPPVKRGRGRPRKSDPPKKTEEENQATLSSSSKDDASKRDNQKNADGGEATPQLPPRRGRPRKSEPPRETKEEAQATPPSKDDTPQEGNQKNEDEGKTTPHLPVKRGRGRPRKVESPLDADILSMGRVLRTRIPKSSIKENDKLQDVQNRKVAKDGAKTDSNKSAGTKGDEQVQNKLLEEAPATKDESDSKAAAGSRMLSENSTSGPTTTEQAADADAPQASEEAKAVAPEPVKPARRWPLKRVMGDFVSNEELLDLWTELQPDMGPLKQKQQTVEEGESLKLSKSLGESLVQKSQSPSLAGKGISTVTKPAICSDKNTSSVNLSVPTTAVIFERRRLENLPGVTSSGATGRTDYLKSVFRSHANTQTQRAKLATNATTTATKSLATECMITSRQVVTMKAGEMLRIKSSSGRQQLGRGAGKTNLVEIKPPKIMDLTAREPERSKLPEANMVTKKLESVVGTSQSQGVTSSHTTVQSDPGMRHENATLDTAAIQKEHFERAAALLGLQKDRRPAEQTSPVKEHSKIGLSTPASLALTNILRNATPNPRNTVTSNTKILSTIKTPTVSAVTMPSHRARTSQSPAAVAAPGSCESATVVQSIPAPFGASATTVPPTVPIGSRAHGMPPNSRVPYTHATSWPVPAVSQILVTAVSVHSSLSSPIHTALAQVNAPSILTGTPSASAGTLQAPLLPQPLVSLVTTPQMLVSSNPLIYSAMPTNASSLHGGPQFVRSSSLGGSSVIPRPTRTPLAQVMSTLVPSPFSSGSGLFSQGSTPLGGGTVPMPIPFGAGGAGTLPIPVLPAHQCLSLSSPKDAVDQLWSIIQQQAQQAQHAGQVQVQQPVLQTPHNMHSYASTKLPPPTTTTTNPLKRPAPDDLPKRVGAKKRKSPHKYQRVWFDEFGKLQSEADPTSHPPEQPLSQDRTPKSSRPRPRIKNASGPRMKMPTYKGSSRDDEWDDRPSSRSDDAETRAPRDQRPDQGLASRRPPKGPSRIPPKVSVRQDRPERLRADDNKENLNRGGTAPPVQANDGYKLLFEVKSDDGFEMRAETMEEAWRQVVEKVQERRNDTRMKSLSFAGVDPLKMLGIKHDALVFLIEQLFGAKNCKRYRFKFHQRHTEAAAGEEPPLNPHGCARAEPFKSRSHHDIFDFLASRHRKRPELEEDTQEQDVQHKSSRRATSLDLPMAMRFRHLKETAKEAVGVFRSHIHGRGLFCRRTIEAGEMVIEYSGNVIRSILTDKREKYYESKGIGCYMFRIDDFDVVDATVHGNAARFINHSCDPNCFSRVIQVDGKKHIVIFASCKIHKGEELTYDYKFPIEDVKIPCNCGALRCRKYLN